VRAAYYDRVGPAREVLTVGELPTPEPGPGEVRVKLGWSGVNPSDVKTRSGARTRALAFPRIVPHSDGAGVIDQVGADVPAARIGERVWVWNAAWGRPFGTAAEYVVLPQGQAVALPPGTELAAGACLGIPALTAYHAVTMDGGVAGQAVLIAGGAGAVGHYAIQFARLRGARTIVATVSSDEKGALARAAGADAIVNYRTDDVAAKCLEATRGAGIDRVIEVDLAANAAVDLAVVRPEGRIVTYGSGAPEMAIPFLPAIVKNVRFSFFMVYHLTPEDRARAVADLTQVLERGLLTHNIAARLPLERIAEAHEQVEQGRVIGNVVLEIA
jgi:NADPH2:quinone reductase